MELQIFKSQDWILNIALRRINFLFLVLEVVLSHIYMYETGIWKGHVHNLALELFLSYGIQQELILLPIITYLSF